MVSYLFCPGHGGGVRWKKGDEKYEVSDHPMYTCSLEGCKSAWGTSDDIFNHCIKPKHHKNFFKKLNPDDTRIAGLSSADILVKAAEYEEEQGGSEERDYEVINIVRDYEKYVELRDRPDEEGLTGDGGDILQLQHGAAG